LWYFYPQTGENFYLYGRHGGSCFSDPERVFSGGVADCFNQSGGKFSTIYKFRYANVPKTVRGRAQEETYPNAV
jgi:hypothetical protein